MAFLDPTHPPKDHTAATKGRTSNHCAGRISLVHSLLCGWMDGCNRERSITVKHNLKIPFGNYLGKTKTCFVVHIVCKCFQYEWFTKKSNLKMVKLLCSWMDGCNGEKSITVIYSKKYNSENNQFPPYKMKRDFLTI